MEFSLNTLYDLEQELESTFGSVFDANPKHLNKSAVMKINKDVLASFVLSVSSILEKSKATLRSAAACIEELKSDKIQKQEAQIKLQEELIKNKEEQIQAVNTTVTSEIRSFSDVVKEGCKDKITPKKLEAVIKSVVKSDDRKRGLMVFGLEESTGEVLSTAESAAKWMNCYLPSALMTSLQ